MLERLSEVLPFPSRGFQARVLFVLLMVATALLAFRTIDDLDYGIHVGTGRWILANGRVPTTDPFTWSIPEHLYIAYHWGFQVIAAALYEQLGHLGPVLLRFVLVVATALAVARTMALRGVDVIAAGVCGLLGIVAAELRFNVRPELFTNLFLALLFVILAKWRSGSERAIWFIPLVFVAWVNTHIYILGFVVLGAHVVEQLYLKRLDRTFVGVLVVAAVALLVNPYGLDAILEPIRLSTRLSKENLFAQHITELASPLTVDGDPRRNYFMIHFWAWGLLLLAAIPAGLALYKVRRIADVICLALFALLSMLAVRNITLFTVVAVPIIAEGLTLWISNRPRTWDAIRRVTFNFVALAALVLCIRVSTGAWYASERRNIHMAGRVERSTLALDAAQFIERVNLKGKGFNNFNIGGALILGAPSHPVYIDGRNEVTGEDFFRNYILTLEPSRFNEFLQTFNIEYVVLGHSNMMHLVRHLLATGNWNVAYYDSVAVVFVRKAGPNGHLPQMPLPMPIRGEEERWFYLKNMEIKPSYIDSFSRWLLGGEELPHEKEQLGTFLLMAGRWVEAERPLLEAAVQAPNFWETLNNLGSLYMRLKEWEVTCLVYRGVLMLNPSDALARERLAMAWYRFKKEALEKQT